MIDDIINASNKTKALILFTFLSVVGFMIYVQPISQDQNYHTFADPRTFLNIPNFFNVITNLAYLVPGALGMYYLQNNWTNKQKFVEPEETIPLYVIFLGSLLLAFGSGFYHLKPDNITLMADRFTMTIGFMAVLSFIISERISVKWGITLLPFLLVLGMASVIYWITPELYFNVGDLRPYALVQTLSLLLILIIYFLYPAKYSHGKYILYALGLYVVAKFFETCDVEIYESLHQLISGHSLKHLASGLGIYFILKYIQERKTLP